MTKKLKSSPVDKAIERILELSADAQIRRREIAKDSLAHYTVTETIAAYGKALALLTALHTIEFRIFRHSFLSGRLPTIPVFVLWLYPQDWTSISGEKPKAGTSPRCICHEDQ